MYETDSGMTNMIEIKLNVDNDKMTKLLLNMGMAWLGNMNEANPPMQLNVKVFLDNSKE